MELTFDKDKLLDYLKSFYDLTHMRIVIFDNDSNELCSYPLGDSKICSVIQNKLGLKNKCIESNQNSFLECKKNNSIAIYKCHASLIEATAVLKSNGVILGYVMIGQRSDIKDKKARYEKMKDVLSYTNDDLSKYKSLIYNIKYKKDDEFKSAAKILEALTNYLMLENYIYLNKNDFKEKLEVFIRDNIQKDINIDDICKYFCCGRTKLYEDAKIYLNMPIAKYITYYRIDLAKKLLLDSKYKIVDVANLVGIEDYNYFTKVFKKLTYLTPSKYKEKYSK